MSSPASAQRARTQSSRPAVSARPSVRARMSPSAIKPPAMQAETLAAGRFRQPKTRRQRLSEGGHWGTQLRLDVRVDIPQRRSRCFKRGLRQIQHPRVAPLEQLRRMEHLQVERQIALIEGVCRTPQPVCCAFRSEMPVEPDQTVVLSDRSAARDQIVARRQIRPRTPHMKRNLDRACQRPRDRRDAGLRSNL